jgi:TonB family protein
MGLASMVLLVLLAQRVHIVDPPDVGDGSIASPELLYYTDHFYARTARDNKVLRTVKRVGFGLEENALAALHSWRFSPAKRNGEPVNAIAQIDIDFSLAAAPPIEYDDVNVGPDASRPTVVRRVEPQYTDEARQAHLVGAVILQTVIQTSGTANILNVVKPLPLGLTESALEAIQQWKFRSAVRNGREIPVATNIEVVFNLEQKQMNQPDVCR